MNEKPSLNTLLYIASDPSLFEPTYELRYKGRIREWDLRYRRNVAIFHVDNNVTDEHIEATVGITVETHPVRLTLDDANEHALKAAFKLLVEFVAEITYKRKWHPVDIRPYVDDIAHVLRPNVHKYEATFGEYVVKFYRNSEKLTFYISREDPWDFVYTRRFDAFLVGK